MNSSRLSPRRPVAGLALTLALLATAALAQTSSAPSETLRRRDFRSGDETLRAFASVSEATRYSIVKLNVDGETVALATVMDARGLALTKASELKPGKLTGWLANGDEVPAERLAVDDELDLALVQVQAKGLKPIHWSATEVTRGQWAITPGIAEIPQAVGIVSALPRRIRPPRPYLGVQFDFNTTEPKIGDILPGLGAEKAGLKAGDLILALNGTTMTNREQIIEIVRECRDGQTVKLRVQRGEEKLDFEVRLTVPGPGQAALGLETAQRANRLTGAVSQRAEGFELAIQHDTVLQPWLCGGPLVNLDGQAIGLNIARAARVASYALPARLAQRAFDRLRLQQERSTKGSK